MDLARDHARAQSTRLVVSVRAPRAPRHPRRDPARHPRRLAASPASTGRNKL